MGIGGIVIIVLSIFVIIKYLIKNNNEIKQERKFNNSEKNK